MLVVGFCVVPALGGEAVDLPALDQPVDRGSVVDHLLGGRGGGGQILRLQPGKAPQKGAPPAAGVHHLHVGRIGDHHRVGVLVLEIVEDSGAVLTRPPRVGKGHGTALGQVHTAEEGGHRLDLVQLEPVLRSLGEGTVHIRPDREKAEAVAPVAKALLADPIGAEAAKEIPHGGGEALLHPGHEVGAHEHEGASHRARADRRPVRAHPLPEEFGVQEGLRINLIKKSLFNPLGN